MKIKHIGKFANRTKGPDYHARLEKAFAEGWAAANQTGTVLGYMLRDGCSPAPITQDQATLAATVIQWLGSPMGAAFVRDILKAVPMERQ